MKRFLLFLVSLVLSSTLFARQLTPDEALSLAMGKLNGATSLRARSLAVGATQSQLSLSHTELSEGNMPLYYVFNISDGGFIITGADSRAVSLLGYTDNGDFEMSKLNPAFMAWLNDCTMAMEWLSKQPETEGAKTNAKSSLPTTLATSVEPLLGDIKWDQGKPYNLSTPTRKLDGKDVNAPTGCVATATAQVMMYHKWPTMGKGKHTNAKESTQTVNFSQSVYNWNSMKPTYSASETGPEAKAVAKLMKDVGCAVDMDYGPQESGASSYSVITALATYFKYDKGMNTQQRTNYTTQNWNNLLYAELDEERPILFCGAASTGGAHEFVLDGYDTNGLFHVNWGWSGMSDGYFDINYLDPYSLGIGASAGGFTIRQAAILGIKPDKDGSSVAKAQVEIGQQITWNEKTNKFSCTFYNMGFGDFKGELGYAMKHPDGTVESISSVSTSSSPVPYLRGGPYDCVAPENSTEGCKVYPYYTDVTSGEMKMFPSPVTGVTYMVCYNDNGTLKWKYDEAELPSLTFSDVNILRHYVGYTAKFKMQVSKDVKTVNEYNESVRVLITKEVEGAAEAVCYGQAQVFLAPGEKKDIEIECVFGNNLEAGDYKYEITYSFGGMEYAYGEPVAFTVEEVVEPSDLSYSDFALDKTELDRDEVLTASMKVTNAGGFDQKDFVFFIFPIIEGNEGQEVSSVAYLYAPATDVAAHAETIVKISGKIDLDYGKYFGAFYHLSDEISNWERIGNKAIKFTVSNNPTAIVEVNEADVTVPSGIFNIYGQRIPEMQKGNIYIINGKKVMR